MKDRRFICTNLENESVPEVRAEHTWKLGRAMYLEELEAKLLFRARDLQIALRGSPLDEELRGGTASLQGYYMGIASRPLLVAVAATTPDAVAITYATSLETGLARGPAFVAFDLARPALIEPCYSARAR